MNISYRKHHEEIIKEMTSRRKLYDEVYGKYDLSIGIPYIYSDITDADTDLINGLKLNLQKKDI